MRIRPRFCRLPERTPNPTNPSGRSSDPPTKSRGTALRTVQIRRPTEQKLAGEQIQQNEVAEELRTHLNRLPVPMDLRSTTWTTSSGTSAAAGARLDAEGGSPSSVSPKELSLFGDGEANRDQDLHLGLGRQGHIGGGSRTPEGGLERQQSGGESERELDLELRLGRRPRH